MTARTHSRLSPPTHQASRRALAGYPCQALSADNPSIAQREPSAAGDAARGVEGAHDDFGHVPKTHTLASYHVRFFVVK
jgi:hypothetical protein